MSGTQGAILKVYIIYYEGVAQGSLDRVVIGPCWAMIGYI